MNCFSYKLFSRLLLTWVAFCLTVPEVTGQSTSSFDPVVYFDRLDRNRDGALTQEELNPRAAKFLLRLGVDARADRIRLKVIRKLLAKQQVSADKQSAEEQQRLSGGLQVPPFGGAG